jgi:hypothetical protein
VNAGASDGTPLGRSRGGRGDARQQGPRRESAASRRGRTRQGGGRQDGRRSPQVSEPLPGGSEFVWLIWNEAPELFTPPDHEWPEVQLSRTPAGQVVATVGATSKSVTPDGAEDADRLMHTMANRARIALLATSKGVDASGRRLVHIGVNLYVYEQADPMDPQTIGVGDRVMSTIGEMDPAVADQPDKILRWLADRLLLPAPPGAGPDAPHRLIVSVGLGEPGEPTGYRIHGRGLVADVRTQDGRLVMHRVRRSDGADAQGPLRLTRCRVTLTDVSRAGELRAEMRYQLGRLATGKGFLAMWHEYNRLETQFVRRQVREVGFARYGRWEALGGEIYRFHVNEMSRLDQELSLAERARQAVNGRSNLELEASGALPAAFTSTGQDSEVDGTGWALLGDELDRRRLRRHGRPAPGGSPETACVGYRTGPVGRAAAARVPLPIVPR